MFHKLNARRKTFYDDFMTSGFLIVPRRETSLVVLRFGKRKVILDKMKTFLIYLIFLLTMLGTSTASGNFSHEGKTCVIFTSALESALISSRYFSSVA